MVRRDVDLGKFITFLAQIFFHELAIGAGWGGIDGNRHTKVRNNEKQQTEYSTLSESALGKSL